MGQERSEAIVVRGVDFSETSRIVTFLTPARGKLACMAQGVRRAKSPMAGALDTFNRLEIVYYWKDGRSVQKLAEAALQHSYPGIKSDLNKSMFAAFPLEFAYKVAQENEPSHELFAALAEGLADMESWTGPARTHAAWQTMRLLAVAGFEPDLSCAQSFEIPVRAGTLDVLRELAALSDTCPVRIDQPEAFESLARYTVRHVDSEFRSLRVIAQMFSK
ncbi:MAG: DNA repair protein RecO [Candidatus Hydrogenedentes bacterium]|nr:DNA repair protein RecO [Candidatus Hydrogenedentota bacterium]